MSSSSTARGIPLLSSPAPPPPGPSESHCKRCNKEFNILFARSKRCNHCGYAYCSNCCDHQALCKRDGQYSGYDALPVCAYCIEMLSITASGRSQLRSMPIAKLRYYLESYNIRPKDVVEKDDLIDAILDAKGDNGCLSLEQEAYYRRETVPKRAQVEARSRNPFSRSSQSSSRPVPPPRPSPQPGQQNMPSSGSPRYYPTSTGPTLPPRPPHSPRPSNQQSSPQYRPPPGPPPNSHHQNQGRTAPPPRPPPPRSSSQNENLRAPQPPPRPQSVPPEMPSSPRPQTQPARQPRPSHAPPPPLSALLDTPKESVAQMSIHILKGILDVNHVNSRLILEKSELVDKVWNLIEVEKRERERERLIHEREEQEAIRRQQELLELFRRQQAEREAAAATSASSNDGINGDANAHDTEEKGEEKEKKQEEATFAPPKPTSTFSLDRDGLCVVCQDEEANIAIVDCGHLALCMGCSETIMKSTRECPLCRTRIVTEQRLLRIFRT